MNIFFRLSQIYLAVVVLLICIIGCENKPTEPTLASPKSKLVVKMLPPDLGAGASAIGLLDKGYAGLGALGFPPSGGGNNKWFLFDSASNQWQNRATLPTPYRYRSLSFKANEKIYVLGGYNTITKNAVTKSFYYKDFWEYNPTSDVWQKKTDLPIDSSEFVKCVAFSANNKGYLLCKDKFWKYDTTTDTWISLGTLPFTTSNVLLGYTRVGNYGISQSTKAYVHIDSVIWEYDAVTNQWTSLNNLSSDYQVLFVINGKGYCGQIGAVAQDSSSIWEYDFLKGNLVKKISFVNPIGNAPMYYGVSFSLENKGYFSYEYRGTMKGFYEFTP